VSADTVWKFPLRLSMGQWVEMPQGARIVHVGLQDAVICAWAIVDPDAPIEHRVFRIVGTGHREIIDGSTYLGTVQQDVYVWHVFEVPAWTERT
jgi:hypothetical protein